MKRILEGRTLFFLLLALLALFPIWGKGYLFLLDWDVQPFISWQDINFFQRSPGWLAFDLAAIILPFSFVQKIALFMLVFFLGRAGYSLAGMIVGDGGSPESRIAMYFGGTFMVLNPFIYGRLADGQVGVAACVLFLAFFIVFLWRYVFSGRRRDLIWSGIMAGCSMMFIIHSVFFIVAIAGVILCWQAVKPRKTMRRRQAFEMGTAVDPNMAVEKVEKNDFSGQSRGKGNNQKIWLVKVAKIFGSFLFIILSAMAFNANVIIGYALDKNINLQAIENFDKQHIEAFRTVEHDDAPVWLNALSLHGYWGEKENRFLSTQENSFIWKPVFCLILALVVFGLWKGIGGDCKVEALAVIGLLSLFLAVGVAHPFSRTLSQFLYDHLPFYIGLREPQKWSGLLLIAYVGFSSNGVKHLLELKEIKKFRSLWTAGLFILLLAYTPNMLPGFRGQFQPTDFPEGWYNMKAYLNQQSDRKKVLFLPWHQYMEFEFTRGKTIVNPAAAFFGKDMVSGDNMEAGKIYSQMERPVSKTVEAYVRQGEKFDTVSFCRDMKSFGFTHILLSQTEDFSIYSWLDRAACLEEKKRENRLILYGFL